MHRSDCSTNNHGCPELLGPCDCVPGLQARVAELERIRTEQDKALSSQNARVSELLDENATIKDRLAAYEHRPTEPNFAVCDDPTIPYDRW